jgi:hypothetical protein
MPRELISNHCPTPPYGSERICKICAVYWSVHIKSQRGVVDQIRIPVTTQTHEISELCELGYCSLS